MCRVLSTFVIIFFGRCISDGFPEDVPQIQVLASQPLTHFSIRHAYMLPKDALAMQVLVTQLVSRHKNHALALTFVFHPSGVS